MSTGTALITAEQFADMSFDQPVELVRGEIVPLNGEDDMTRPSQAHGWVCAEIAGNLGNWAKETRAGRVTSNAGWITTGCNPDSVRGADVAYFRMDRLLNGKLSLKPSDLVPDLCVEVLSPSDQWREVHAKITEYFACGVREVWIANPARRSVEVFLPDEAPTVFQGSEPLTSRELPGFAEPVEIFLKRCEERRSGHLARDESGVRASPRGGRVNSSATRDKGTRGRGDKEKGRTVGEF